MLFKPMNAKGFLLLIVVAGTACKQEEETPPGAGTIQVHTVDLRLKFVFKYGTHDYELASEYTDVTGRLFKLDRIKFLLSDLDVVNDNNVVLAEYPTVNLLVDAQNATNDFALGTLTAGHVHQIRFNIGLDPALNNTNPAGAASPLDDTTMHWGVGADEGYWFLILEGQVDTDDNGVLDTGFSMRCGTDGLLRSGWAIMHALLPDGGTHTVETVVDVERLIGGVNVMDNLNSQGAHPINVQLMDSLAANFHQSH